MGRSKYVKEDHLLITVDGRALDELLDEKIPGREILGLVPAWLDWMEYELDRQETFRRLTTSESDMVTPLLMCPDDLDFSCSLIVAETRIIGNEVMWQRVGVNRSEISGVPEELGRRVEWFDDLERMSFDLNEYGECVREFLENWENPNVPRNR